MEPIPQGDITVSPSLKPSKKANRRTVPKQRKKRLPTKSPYTPPAPTPPLPFHQSFSILPDASFHPTVSNLLKYMPSSFQKRTAFLQRWSKNPFSTFQSISRPSFSSPPIDPLNAFWSPLLYKSIKLAVASTVRKRAIFRRFLHHWRFKRLKVANEEDPVTCDPPFHPVSIVDWSGRIRYQFEASTLMRDITNRLMNHEGFFDEPLAPRNPLTNLPFTLSQSISIFHQLISHGSSVSPSWSFTCFYHSMFRLQRFSVEYRIPLQLHALRTTLNDSTDIDMRERLLDFIQYEHEHNLKHFHKMTYLNAIIRHFNHPRIQTWKQLCQQFYEAHIKYYHNQEILSSIHESIHTKALRYCHRPDELITLYRNDIASRGQVVVDENENEEEDEYDIEINLSSIFASIGIAGIPNTIATVIPL